MGTPLRRALGLGLALSACGPTTEWASSGHRAIIEVETEPFAVRVHRDGRELLRLFGGDGRYGAVAATIDNPEFVPQLIPGWDGYRAREDRWRVAAAPVIESASDDEVSIRFEEGLEAQLDLRVSGDRIRIELRTEALVPHTPGGTHTKSSVAFHLPPDAHFFGLGERTATVDHRGWSLYNWCEEGGLGQGEGAEPGPDNPSPNGVSMTNFPVPLVHVSSGYLLHLDTFDRSEFHMGNERPDAWRIAVNRNRFALTVYTDPSPLRNIDLYTQDTGRPLVPAPWVFGPRRRMNQGDQVFGEDEWRMLRERGVPTTSIDDNVHFLPHGSHLGREERLRNWVDTLHRHGFKVMAYNNPYVSTTEPKVADDFAYGASKDLFLRDGRGRVAETFLISGTPQNVATIDLTQETGRAWFRDLLMRTLDLGYDGWMHDFGEYVERDWRAADGRHGDALHNRYPVLSAQTAFELMSRERPDGFHIHVRAGYAGSQAFVPAVWNGDPEASFDPTQGLPASLFAGLNLSMSGIAYWGSDIGGFKCYGDAPRDKELYLRWAQLGAVSPIMQSQNACVYLTGQRTKWRLWDDDETVQVYGAMARLHTRLQPYLSSLAREAHQTGAPLMRHPFLRFPEHPGAWAVRSAYFLGDALYAAPVVRRGAREKTVWLPPGRYLEWNEARPLDGDRVVTVSAPLDRLPLFLVENQLLPMLDRSIETLAEAAVPGVVTPSRVADRLDAVAFVTRGQARRSLENGTELALTVLDRSATPSPPLTEVAPAQVADCARCYAVETSTVTGVTRLRVSTAEVATDEVHLGRLRLVHRAERPLRVRWDLYLADAALGPPGAP